MSNIENQRTSGGKQLAVLVIPPKMKRGPSTRMMSKSGSPPIKKMSTKRALVKKKDSLFDFQE